MSTVLVTGGSGFLGSHVILKLLNAGHEVRATVRSLNREETVRTMLRDAGADPRERLSFFAADLGRDEGWAEAVAGCDFMMHVASPMPAAAPKNEDELIIPARAGVLRVLKAARDAEGSSADAAGRVPTRQLPDWFVRFVALFDPRMRQLLPLLGHVRHASSAKAERVLGWKPRPREDAIVATASSLRKFGLV